MKRLVLVLAALLLAACSPPAGRPAGVNESAVAVPAIEGRLDFDRQTLATLASVASGATLALIDPATGAAVATSLSDAAGVFSLSFGSFVPTVNAVYILEAFKGLNSGAAGAGGARVRTFIRFNGTAWEAITAGSVSVSTGTTALCAIQGYRAATLSPASLIGRIDAGGTYNEVAGASSAEYTYLGNLIASLLAADHDPIAQIAYDASTSLFYQKRVGNLAPGDGGDPARHHEFQLTKGGVASTFVWIPLFRAYQLIVPANCGAEHSGKPVGYWVASQPSAGTRDVDWAEERFGGFYAGKYEASRADATPGDPATGAGATAGSSSTLKVARYCVPWTGIDWDTAALTCMAYDSHAHLMRDEEWTALAVWATINNITVYGNNAQTSQAASYVKPADIDNPDVTFLDDPTYTWSANGVDRALTGSGTASAWTGFTNLTSHTGKNFGVWDLTGNVTEWTETVGLAQTTGNFIVNDIILPLPSPADNYISALATDPRLRRHGLPGATAVTAAALFGGDYFWKSASSNKKAFRGGAWTYGGTAGLWYLDLYVVRSDSSSGIGFRPALTY
ncbi:MAG: hypothetical protein FJZ01_27000 [Candidatus Sericytochromatia bacterium]|nr:hypothetical protein [Candidatus Tanganyikabacteria bacterium]